VHESPPAAWSALGLVHDGEYLRRVREGLLDRREQRVLGLPWSPELVERGRRSSQGTVAATRDAIDGGHGINLGGGTHHAGRGAGRGFCLFNDVVLAVRSFPERRFLVVDCDVHQGDGTAELLAGDERAFALSIHGGGNYPFKRPPSDLDVDLPDGTGDDGYLDALEAALAQAVPRARPDVVVYLAGADPWEGDALGRLALTKAGLRERDTIVLDTAARAGAALVLTLAGGYAPDVRDTVAINEAAVLAVAGRAGRAAAPGPASGTTG